MVKILHWFLTTPLCTVDAFQIKSEDISAMLHSRSVTYTVI